MLANYSLETPVIGLVGEGVPHRLTWRDVGARTSESNVAKSLGLSDQFAVLGSFIAGPEALARFSAHASLNTDDRPTVAYRAPRITYAPNSRPKDRLIAVLNELSIAPAELLADESHVLSERLAAYWRARDEFIRVGRHVRQTSDVSAMLAQVHEPLLAVLRISPDFSPASEPLVAMASALSQTNPKQARALLNEVTALSSR